MHILPCSLTLLLAFVVPAAAAGGDSMECLLGSWKGSVKSSPDDCVWAVESGVGGKAQEINGIFSYAGKCAPKKRAGTFTAKPTKPGCFSAIAEVKGMPKMNMSGCIDSKGLVKFSCPAFKGTVQFSKDWSSVKLVVNAGPGGAAGTFKRTSKKPVAVRGRAGKKDTDEDNGEVRIGGDAPDGTKPFEIHKSSD
ncbi:MAG: hypothetical protein Q7R35_02805 [Elusimicrobiota bacterium]|nr:hypothetical protein [Elusimicrobiota bacterium]